jgi:hypothetical protein
MTPGDVVLAFVDPRKKVGTLRASVFAKLLSGKLVLTFVDPR